VFVDFSHPLVSAPLCHSFRRFAQIEKEWWNKDNIWASPSYPELSKTKKTDPKRWWKDPSRHVVSIDKTLEDLLFAESVNVKNPHLFDYGALARFAGSWIIQLWRNYW
jgi:hypothetical protein